MVDPGQREEESGDCHRRCATLHGGKMAAAGNRQWAEFDDEIGHGIEVLSGQVAGTSPPDR